MNKFHHKYIIIGGGIAGVTCLETLSQDNTEESILLVTASPLVKVISNYQRVTENLHSFDVEEQPFTSLPASPNVTILHDTVLSLDPTRREITTRNHGNAAYDRLCICTGASPKVLYADSEYVLGIRDTESVQDFQKKLSSARRIIVVGNGGIATEVVHETENCDIVWAVKDDSIVSAFVDCGAGAFFLNEISHKHKPTPHEPCKRLKYAIKGDFTKGDNSLKGSALGPDWLNDFKFHGLQTSDGRGSVHVEYNVEVVRLWSVDEFRASGQTGHCPFTDKVGSSQETDESRWPVYVELSNHRIYGCDFIVSATGVTPNSHAFSPRLSTSSDGGIQINDRMTTCDSCVYAAGDVATADWDIAPHWLQMRLWTQARQHGHYAAKCMRADAEGETIHMDICFDLFAHVTKFFGFKVILLGRFNGQGLRDDHSLLLRTTPGTEYVKAVLQDGRLQGAILIGETDLEETFENLILNQIDLSRYGEDLLDPNIDIEDYFD